MDPMTGQHRWRIETNLVGVPEVVWCSIYTRIYGIRIHASIHVHYIYIIFLSIHLFIYLFIFFIYLLCWKHCTRIESYRTIDTAICWTETVWWHDGLHKITETVQRCTANFLAEPGTWQQVPFEDKIPWQDQAPCCLTIEKCHRGAKPSRILHHMYINMYWLYGSCKWRM